MMTFGFSPADIKRKVVMIEKLRRRVSEAPGPYEHSLLSGGQCSSDAVQLPS